MDVIALPQSFYPDTFYQNTLLLDDVPLKAFDFGLFEDQVIDSKLLRYQNALLLVTLRSFAEPRSES